MENKQKKYISHCKDFCWIIIYAVALAFEIFLIVAYAICKLIDCLAKTCNQCIITILAICMIMILVIAMVLFPSGCAILYAIEKQKKLDIKDIDDAQKNEKKLNIKDIDEVPNDEKLSNRVLILLKLICIFSPDYLATYLSKKFINYYKLSNTENCRKLFIEAKNEINLGFSLVLVILMFVMSCPLIDYLVLIRFISRTIEINVSFILDIVEKKKSSSLNKYERILLAFGSLLEEAALFSGIYLILDLDKCHAILAGLYSFILNRYECEECNVLFQYLSVYQVFSSLVLITLSFASYISYKDTND